MENIERPRLLYTLLNLATKKLIFATRLCHKKELIWQHYPVLFTSKKSFTFFKAK